MKNDYREDMIFKHPFLINIKMKVLKYLLGCIASLVVVTCQKTTKVLETRLKNSYTLLLCLKPVAEYRLRK